MTGLDILGAELVGDGALDFIPSLFRGAGELTQKGVEYGLAERAKSQAAGDESKRLQASISADAGAVSAVTQALFSAGMGDKAKAAADQQAADLAEAAQDKAGASLSTDDSRSKRLDAAQKLVAAAVANLQKAPTDPWKKANVQAAQKTATKAAAAQIAAVPPSDQGAVKKKQEEGQADANKAAGVNEGFLSTKIAGPVKVWHAGLGGALLGGLWWLRR